MQTLSAQLRFQLIGFGADADRNPSFRHFCDKQLLFYNLDFFNYYYSFIPFSRLSNADTLKVEFIFSIFLAFECFLKVFILENNFQSKGWVVGSVDEWYRRKSWLMCLGNACDSTTVEPNFSLKSKRLKRQEFRCFSDSNLHQIWKIW